MAGGLWEGPEERNESSASQWGHSEDPRQEAVRALGNLQ